MSFFNVIFHHGGEFVRDGHLFYRGGVETIISDQDYDKWSFCEAVSLVKDWGYNEVNFRLWRKIDRVDEYFKLMLEDSHAMEIEVGDEESCYNSDEEVNGIIFEDSEEERTKALDEGFVEVEKALEGSSRTIINRKKFGTKSSALAPTKVVGGYKRKADFEKVNDDDYVSDELGSSDPDDSDKETGPKYEKFRKEQLTKDYEFKLGMEFNALVEFKNAIREWSVLNGREIKFVKNDKVRVRVECRSKCGFLAHVSKVGDRHTYQLKTWVGTHTCARVLNNKSANSQWVAKAVVEKLHSVEKVRVSEIMSTDMRRNHSVGITKGKAWKAKEIAEQIIEGDAARQYAMLWSYAAELRRVSVGNTCKINVERPSPTLQPRFGKFYFCFDGCKKGFSMACRPFIGVDGCHLKTKYGGQLLVAVGRDPNDQYFPLAFGGLIPVVEEMFDRIEHRVCLRHLYANFKKKFGGGTLIRDLMMGAAKATYYKAWEKKMSELKQLDQKAWEWLMGVPTRGWCKHAFSFYPKCDVLMNNISESFNSTILVARDKPILTMCEWIRNYLMNRMAISVSKLDKWQHNVMPIPRKRLDHEVLLSGQWVPTWSGEQCWQINHAYNGHQFIVDLAKKTCTCCFWDLVGIPCRHVVAAMSYEKKSPESYVDNYYKREAYKLCYSFSVSPINGMDMWPNVEADEMLPPSYKKGPGRPKKLRFREHDEGGARMRRPGVAYRCTNCDKFGHNSRKCKSAKNNQDALIRKRKLTNKQQKSDMEGETVAETEPVVAHVTAVIEEEVVTDI
ncbi:uncharacterized protein LOC131658483 [Vicia villosa]|uniref:uncharacterized protein LOC131658483 n=1 Tax=Vicia villosa TaxID=3911 RepID=UPI00273B957E|nr:uncharacterized protein LOC131658483 [Vicia villosa]